MKKRLPLLVAMAVILVVVLVVAIFVPRGSDHKTQPTTNSQATAAAGQPAAAQPCGSKGWKIISPRLVKIHPTGTAVVEIQACRRVMANLVILDYATGAGATYPYLQVPGPITQGLHVYKVFKIGIKTDPPDSEQDIRILAVSTGCMIGIWYVKPEASGGIDLSGGPPKGCTAAEWATMAQVRVIET